MNEGRGFLLLVAGAGVLVIIQQVAELLPALLQTSYGEAEARFRLLARVGGRAPALSAALVMITGAAVALGHPRTVGGLGRSYLCLGVLLLILLPVLLLDAGTLAGAAGGAPTLSLWVQVGRIAAFLLGGGVLAIVAGRHLRRWRGAASPVMSSADPGQGPLPG